jgi:acetyl-CoA carboxylase biotin carboxyl carrier protein
MTMADLPTSLSKVPRGNRIPFDAGPDPVRMPDAGQIQWVLDGACRLADIVRRSEMRRISVTVAGVHWEIEAPEPAGGAAGSVAEVPAAPEPEPGAVAGHQLGAPLVGVFYRARNPGAAPFVEVGDRVEPGTQVAIVEAMKLMNEVVADRVGVITAVHVEDGDVVEFGQPLFTIGPA